MSPYVIPGIGPSPETILQLVSDKYGMSVDDLISTKSKHDISRARAVAMWLMRKVLKMSYQNIGAEFPNKNGKSKNHTLVSRAVKKVSDHALIYQEENKILSELAKKAMSIRAVDNKHKSGRLSQRQKSEIRDLMNVGATGAEISKLYGISEQHAYDIRNMKRWKKKKTDKKEEDKVDTPTKYTNISGHIKSMEKYSQ